MRNDVTVKKIVIKNDLKYNGVTLITYKIEYPEFRSSCYRVCLLKVNRFYKKNALDYKKYIETELYRMAVEQYKGDIANGYPIRVFEALQTYDVMYLNKCVISIYFDRYEYTGGAHGNTVRTSQTWNLLKCSLIQLYQLVRCCPDYKTYILNEVETQIEENPEIYFEDYRVLIDETFDRNNFYATPGGVVVYYQQYDIAPYSSGIREFLIPYSDCVINPEKCCSNQ
jgi:hypothetical protein